MEIFLRIISGYPRHSRTLLLIQFTKRTLLLNIRLQMRIFLNPRRYSKLFLVGKYFYEFKECFSEIFGMIAQRTELW